MTLAHARALLPADAGEPCVHEHDTARDAASLDALAQWMVRFTPLVSTDPPCGLLLNVSGCERLYGGERKLINRIGNTLEWMGVRARMAIASTIGCAWALSRYASRDRIIVEPGGEYRAIQTLPIESLRLDDDTIDALIEVGVERIEELLAIPRLELASRFGSDLLLRIDQASGEAIESITPIRMAAPPRAGRTFDGPVKQVEAIEQTFRDVLHDLIDQLQQCECGVCQLRIDIQRIGASSSADTIALSRPSRDPKHLWSLLALKVEAIHLGFGIERIELTATQIELMPHEQLQTTRDGSRGTPVADIRACRKVEGELVDAFAQRLGPRSLTRVMAVESHVPERAFCHVPVMTGSSMERNDPSSTSAVVTLADRPSLLFSHMQPIEVLTVSPEGPLLQISWQGESHDIVSTHGPERIEHEWWNAHAHDVSHAPASMRSNVAARDYYRVQTARGRWLWICRLHTTGRWFVHGEWM